VSIHALEGVDQWEQEECGVNREVGGESGMESEGLGERFTLGSSYLDTGHTYPCFSRLTILSGP
jgi:hypothetical protein